MAKRLSKVITLNVQQRGFLVAICGWNLKIRSSGRRPLIQNNLLTGAKRNGMEQQCFFVNFAKVFDLVL